MQPVTITEIKDAGHFLCQPSHGQHQADDYMDFLAALNTFCENQNATPAPFAPRVGDMICCYVAVGQSHNKLWYRGRVLQVFNNSGGVIVKTLLVDEGKPDYVPKMRLRRLPDKFVDFPHQIMECKLTGVVPITLGPSMDSLLSLQRSWKWDNSATKFLEGVVKEAVSMSVDVGYSGSDGIDFVTLYAHEANGNLVNVNDLLVKKGYATHDKPEKSVTSNDKNSTIQQQNNFLAEASAPVACDLSSILRMDKMKRDSELNKQKKMQSEDAKRIYSADVQDLLSLIGHGASDRDSGIDEGSTKADGRSRQPVCFVNNSSDISDMEITPVAPSVSYKDKLAESRRAQLLSNMFGGDSPEKLSKVFDIDPDQFTSPSLPAPKQKANIQPRTMFPSSTPPERSLNSYRYEAQREHQSQDPVIEKPPSARWPSKSPRSSDMSPTEGFDRSYEKRQSDSRRSSRHVSFSSKELGRGSGYSSSENESIMPAETRSTAKSDSSKQFSLFSESSYRPDPIHEQSEESLMSSTGLMRALNVLSTEDYRKQTKDQKSTFNNSDDILVSGKAKSEPFTSIDYLHLPLPLKAALRGVGVTDPSPFQSHVWPAVMKGRDIVGIAESTVGKTVAYLLPILTNIVEPEGVYKSLGKGNGPFLLILVPSWQEAQRIYDVCYQLVVYYRKRTRVEIVYGGRDCEGDKNIQLINGCEILISTVPFINKMIDLGYTNLNRACHIVFDNADVLVENFTEEIKVLMRGYATLIKKKKRFDAPRQLIAMGIKWSHGIKSLMDNYLTDPLVIIGNKVEVSLFAKINHVVELCQSEERLDTLVAFLETDAVEHNTIIYTGSAREADQMHNHLKQYSISSMIVTEFTPPPEIRDIRLWWNANWDKKTNLLIMSDAAGARSTIRNATCVVNFDFPQKKSIFGNRLGSMLDSIRVNLGQEDGEKLISQIFITEKNCARYTTGLIKLLNRAGQEVPPLLQSMGQSAREIKEEEKKYADLCEKLKLFGACPHIDQCGERHTIFPEVDLLNLVPTSGIIKVVVLDVITASSYWARIVEHRLPFDPKGKTYDTSVYLKLAMDMQLYFANPSNRKRLVNPKLFDCCAIRMKDGYQRVRIEKIEEKDLTSAAPTKLKVFGMDNGQTQVVDALELLMLSDDLKNIPPQAVEIIASSVKPMDKGTQWTIDSCLAMEDQVLGKTLEGRVQFSLRNSIWVDPLVEKQKLEGVNIVTCTLNVGVDLISYGFGVKNAKHVENLRKLMQDVQGLQNIDKKLLPNHKAPVMQEQETAFLQDDDYEEVYVSAVVHPGLFFVQRMECCQEIERLDNKINATMQVKELDPDEQVKALPIGYICVAEFSVDQKWYRAKILDVKDDEYEVFFVDHGDREWLPRDKLCQSWPDIMRSQFQAIECSFLHITPMTTEWSWEDGDVLWDMVQEKLLTAKVISTGVSQYVPETISYSIELFDTSGDTTMNISHELVFSGVAQGSLECLQQMFPYASSRERTAYDDIWQKVPDLCMKIHHQQKEEEKLALCTEVHSIVEENKSDHTGMIESGTVQSLVKLLCLSRSPKLQDDLIKCLVCAVSSNKEVSEIIRLEGGIKAVCHILGATTDDCLQMTCVNSLSKLGRDEQYQDIVHQYGGTCLLCKILQKATSDTLKTKICNALMMLCKDHEKNCHVVRQEDGLDAICKMLRHSEDKPLLQACATVLTVLLRDPRNQEQVRCIGGLQVIAATINKNVNEVTLRDLLLSLQLCVEKSEANRDYLHMLGAHDLIKKRSQEPVRHSVAVRQLFNDLVNRITPAPIMQFQSMDDEDEEIEEQLMRNPIDAEESPVARDIHLLEQEDDIEYEKTPPKTQWSQRKNTITLSIKLRGINRDRTEISEQRVVFRTVLASVHYELNIELFDKICPKESRVLLKGGEVLLILRKQELGNIWPRLLKTTQKPPYISVDFDRWVEEFPDNPDSNDDDDNPNPDIVLFKADLPPPPPCTAYDDTNVKPTAILPDYGLSAESSGSDSTDDERDADREHKHPDYFNI